MVSAQIPGTLRFYKQDANNRRILLYSGTMAALGPSGSSEGTIASTPEKWLFVPPVLSPEKIMMPNDKLVCTVEVDAAATMDASDCEFSIPLVTRDGTPEQVGSPDNSSHWDVKQGGDVALLAGTEIDVCIKTIRAQRAFGGGLIFASIENNA